MWAQTANKIQGRSLYDNDDSIAMLNVKDAI